MAGAGVVLPNINDIPRAVQPHVISFGGRIPDAVFRAEFIDAIALNDRNALLNLITRIPEIMTEDAHKALIKLYEVMDMPAPPVPAAAGAAPPPTGRHTIKGNASFLAHFMQFIGMLGEQNRNLIQASLDGNTEAQVISTLSLIIAIKFPEARIIDEKTKKQMVACACIGSWMSEPENFNGGKFVEDLRLWLRPDDDHANPLDGDDARTLVFKFFGAITEPEVAQWLKRQFELTYELMMDGEYGTEKISKSQLFKIFVKYSFDKLQNKVVAIGEDVLEFLDDNLRTMKQKMVQLIEKETKTIEKAKTVQLEATLRTMQQQMAKIQLPTQQQSHTHFAAVSSGSGTQPATTGPAAAPVPRGWERGGTKNPVQPQGPFPDMPPGLAYPNQPCFAWVGGYCNMHGRCRKGKPHDWGTSTPAQKSATEAYATRIKPHNVYNIWTAWVDNIC